MAAAIMQAPRRSMGDAGINVENTEFPNVHIIQMAAMVNANTPTPAKMLVFVFNGRDAFVWFSLFIFCFSFLLRRDA